MDPKRDMETDVPANRPKTKLPSGPTKPSHGYQKVSGLLTGGKLMTSKYNRIEVQGTLCYRPGVRGLGNNLYMVTEHQCAPTAYHKGGA